MTGAGTNGTAPSSKRALCSAHDRRSIRIRLSPKGLDLCKRIAVMFDSHAGAIAQGTLKDEQLKTASQTYRELERFWAGLLDYGARIPRIGTTTAA